jgi:integrase
LIKSYLQARQTDGIGQWQILKSLYCLLELAKILLTSFRDAERDDIARVIGVIETRPYTAWTKSDYKVMCKRFYRWVRGTEDYPPEVRWIKCRIANAQRKLPEELLTAEDVQHMVGCAEYSRDRALILALFESGCRIGEIGQLRIRHVEFDGHGAKLIVRGKTGMRRIRVVRAAALIKQWLTDHPAGSDFDSPLWLGLRGRNRNRIMTRDAIARVLERTAKKAGILKHIHPHLFRHSRATELASQLTEAQLKEVFGWTAGSTQSATYVHLSGRNVDDALLKTFRAVEAQPMRATAQFGLPGSGLGDALVRLLHDPETVAFLNRRSCELGLFAPRRNR